MNTRCIWAKTARDADVIVIGGGAAGMLAALRAGESGARVIVLERNEKLGKKIYITGKGRCNVTNTADFEDFFRQIPHNPRFLNAAIRSFSNQDLMALLETLGLSLKEERGGRVFPQSDKASDVTRTLERGMRQAGVQVRLNARVKALDADENGVTGVILESGETLCAPCVIVATGGCSYPSTGSTGDGYAFASAMGHTVETPRSSLVGLLTREEWPRQLTGLSLRNVRLSAQWGKKKVFDQLGEMLFTHFGVSGPLVLELSSDIDRQPMEEIEVSIDLKPGLTPEQVDKRLQREFEANTRKQFSSILPALLPGKLAEIFPQMCGIAANTPINQITRAQRMELGALLKRLPLHLTGFRPIEEAIVTRGGVNVKEITPGTMMSKRVPGLFFAGEVLDVDAHTGGFNLQIAFSTGALAGVSAAQYALETAEA